MKWLCLTMQDQQHIRADQPLGTSLVSSWRWLQPTQQASFPMYPLYLPNAVLPPRRIARAQPAKPPTPTPSSPIACIPLLYRSSSLNLDAAVLRKYCLYIIHSDFNWTLQVHLLSRQSRDPKEPKDTLVVQSRESGWSRRCCNPDFRQN